MRKPLDRMAFSPATAGRARNAGIKTDASRERLRHKISWIIFIMPVETVTPRQNPATTVTHLECALCSKIFKAGEIHNLCECGGPLLVRYDLARIRDSW